MKPIYMVELFYNDRLCTSRIVGIWYFTTMKRAIEYGEYKYRVEEDVKSYHIRTVDRNPEWFSLKNPYYHKI